MLTNLYKAPMGREMGPKIALAGLGPVALGPKPKIEALHKECTRHCTRSAQGTAQGGMLGDFPNILINI